MAKTIDDYKKDYAAAQAAGDKAGMDAAHQGAEAIRAQSGYSGGVDGSQYIPIAPKGYKGSSTGVKTYDDQQASIVEQMNANSKAWFDADEAGKKLLHEQNEYLAGLLGGTVSYDPSSGKWAGSANVGYQSQQSTQIDSLLEDILNRKKFKYDYTTDPSYLAYADQYKRLGDRAREDVLGDVASLNGGYASSWATSAASQAQNDYNQQLSNVIPTLYDAAYNRHVDDYNMDVTNLGLLMDVDNTNYNRYRDTVGDTQWDKQFGLSKDQFQFEKDKFAYTQDQDELDRLMNKWQLTGVADAEVAKAFGVDVGKTTESYEFKKLQADQEAAEKAEAEAAKQADRDTIIEAAKQALGEYGIDTKGKWKDTVTNAAEARVTAKAVLAEMKNYDMGLSDYYEICDELGVDRETAASVFNAYADEMEKKEADAAKTEAEKAASQSYMYYAALMGNQGDPEAQRAWLEGAKFSMPEGMYEKLLKLLGEEADE